MIMDPLKPHSNRSRMNSLRSKFWRSIATSALAALVLLCQPAPSLAQQQVNPATWMSDQSDFIANIPLKGIAMLGSHDPATNNVPAYGDLEKNQQYDFAGQLNQGVRWFDTRITLLDSNAKGTNGSSCNFLNGNYFTSGAGYYLYGHNYLCSGITLPSMLTQISRFLDQNPKEIVILQMNGTISNGYPTVSTSADFMTVLDQNLRRASDNASYIYDKATACGLAGYGYAATSAYQGNCSGPPLPPQEVTPQQLYGTSARVILLEDYGLGIAPLTPRLTWVDKDDSSHNEVGHERLAGYYELGGVNGAGAGDVNLELSWLEYGSPIDPSAEGLYGLRGPSWASYEADSKFLALQAELTPDGAVNGVIDFYTGYGPLYLAKYFNPALNSALQTTWQPYSVNIVSIDDSDEYGVLQNVVAYNAKTFGRAPSGYVTPTQVVVGRDGNVYKVASGTIWQRTNFTGQPYDWTPLGFPASRLAVDPSRFFWTINSSGGITEFPFGFSWTVSGIQFQDIAAGMDGAIYALSTAGDPYQLYVNQANFTLSYSAVPGIHNLISIAAGPANTLTAADTSGTVWRYASNGNWTNLNNNPSNFRASSVTVDEAGNVWATQRESTLETIPRPLTNSSIPYSRVWRLAAGSWSPYRTDSVQVSAGAGGANNVDVIYALSHDGELHNLRYNLSTGLGAQAPPPRRYAATVSVSGLTFNHATQLFTGTLTVTNNTGSPITDQLAVVFQGLPQGVTIANNPLTYQELPFILMPSVSLQPGESTSAQIQFSNPDLVHINYLTQVFAYVTGS